MRPASIILIILLAAAVAGFAWFYLHKSSATDQIILYGNVDLREVDLAFREPERIAQVLVEEGNAVTPGQIVARLDPVRIQAALDQAKAMYAAQQSALDRLLNGSRPEEIDEARANVRLAEADLADAQKTNDRLVEAFSTHAVSQQQVDDAKAALAVAKARLEVARSSLQLSVIGPRKEDIDEARARLLADKATLAEAAKDMHDAVLVSPTNGVVRSRLLEPGDMAGPDKPVFSISVTDPKWVRAYVAETQLGRVRLGQSADITSDTFPGRKYKGWVGFISPVAEFTPKDVQTPELRTQLVYEIRIFVHDPDNELRLGMPATVHVLTDQPLTTMPSTRESTTEQ